MWKCCCENLQPNLCVNQIVTSRWYHPYTEGEFYSHCMWGLVVFQGWSERHHGCVANSASKPFPKQTQDGTKLAVADGFWMVGTNSGTGRGSHVYFILSNLLCTCLFYFLDWFVSNAFPEIWHACWIQAELIFQHGSCTVLYKLYSLI